jgi:hypothetical protein
MPRALASGGTSSFSSKTVLYSQMLWEFFIFLQPPPLKIKEEKEGLLPRSFHNSLFTPSYLKRGFFIVSLIKTLIKIIL